MKLVTRLLVLGLAISIVINIMLYLRNERRRPQFTVNGRMYSKREYHDFMEQHFGMRAEGRMIMNYLLTDAATKAGVLPTDADVREAIADEAELKPEVALQLENPIVKSDIEMQARDSLALFNLASKDIKPTEDELKTFYEMRGSTSYDRPTKVWIRVIQTASSQPDAAMPYLTSAKAMVDSMAGRATEEKPAPGVTQKVLTDIAMVGRQLAPNAGLIRIPLVIRSDQQRFAAVKDLPVGATKILPPNRLIYVEKREEGQKTSLADPATRKKVERDYKLSRQKNVDEVKRQLWDSALIKTDPESDKEKVEHVLFPDVKPKK